jgi:hypothetical protein
VKLPSKRELRAELDSGIENYLEEGGVINEIPRGLSAFQPGDPPLRTEHFQPSQAPSERTPVPEIVAAIEARKHIKPAKHKPTKSTRPKRKLILDDFGEPLRWEWVDNN